MPHRCRCLTRRGKTPTGSIEALIIRRGRLPKYHIYAIFLLVRTTERGVMWQVDFGPIREWVASLDDETLKYIFAATDILEMQGPALGRPLVDTLKGSSVKNLKELRPASPGETEIRILFAFDPKRSAILLVGGNKASGKNKKDKWSGWYKKAIPQAEHLWSEHLREL